MLHQIARTVVRRASRNAPRSSSYHAPSEFRPPSLDECPVPQGSWQKHYDAKQKVYNMQLAAGIVIMAGTIIFTVKSEMMFFNAFPPSPKTQ